jgi:YD repeat-containing protein
MTTPYTNASYIINHQRGNATTTTKYSLTSAPNAVSHAWYFDNGTPFQIQDANGHVTMTVTAHDFSPCRGGPRKTTTVVNALSQATTSAVDCNTSQSLSVTDPNAQRSCTQLDALGRVVESAVPGDTLTPLAGGTRDPACPLNTGNVLGNGGNGPTAWTAYCLPGSTMNPPACIAIAATAAATIEHVKDGTSNGRYTKAYHDGLVRSVEVCAEVDPSAEEDGSVEACSVTSYDAMGRKSQEWAAFGVKTPSTAAAAPSSAAYATYKYDALGRTIESAFVGLDGVAFITTTAYSGAAPNWVTDTANPNGNHTKSLADALERVIETDGANCAVSGMTSATNCNANFLATKMTYDAAGRLLNETDSEGNVLSFVYDGLGRKTQMHDPDLGFWQYGYDPNGNLTSQTDARGATTTMAYDALDRRILTNLPWLCTSATSPSCSAPTWKSPAGLSPDGVEDVVYTYDGNLPSGCASCDDHDGTTTDACHTATATCIHTKPGADAGADASKGTDSGGDASQGTQPDCTPECMGVQCGLSDGCRKSDGGPELCTANGPVPGCTPKACPACYSDDGTGENCVAKTGGSCTPAGGGTGSCVNGVCAAAGPATICERVDSAGTSGISCSTGCGCNLCYDASVIETSCPPSCQAACPAVTCKQANGAVTACSSSGCGCVDCRTVDGVSVSCSAVGCTWDCNAATSCADTNPPATVTSCTSGCGCNDCKNYGGNTVTCPSTCTAPCEAATCRNAAAYAVSCSSGCGCTNCYAANTVNPALDGEATTCPSTCTAACTGACGPVKAYTGWTLGGPINRFQSNSVPRFLLQATSTPPSGYSIADYGDFYLASGPTQDGYTGLQPLYICLGYLSVDCTCNGAGYNYGAMGYLSPTKQSASMLRLIQVNNPTTNDKTWVTEDKLASYSYIGFTVVGTSVGYVWTGSAP